VAHPLEEEVATKLPTKPRPKTKQKTTKVGWGRQARATR